MISIFNTIFAFLLFLIVFTVQIIWIIGFVTIDDLCLFYLPAMVVVLTALIFSYTALLGVFLGNLICTYLTLNSLQFYSLVTLSAVPALSGAIAIFMCSHTNKNIREFLGSAPSGSEIDALDIFYFCAVYSIVHSLILFLYGGFGQGASIEVIINQTCGILFGNLSGSFIGFIGVNLVYTFVNRALIRHS